MRFWLCGGCLGVLRSSAAAAFVCLLAATPASADGVTLRDGTVLTGAVEQEGNLVQVADGLRRMIVGTRRVTHVDPNARLASNRQFRISQPSGPRNTVIDNVIVVIEVTPFNEFGRRTFSVRDPVRGRVDIQQAITEIGPDHVKVQAIGHLWESCIATHAIPADTIEAILRNHTDSKRVDDRLRLAQFFLDVGWFAKAESELKAIEQEFPQVADQVREAMGLLKQQRARRILDEINLRRRVGQNGFAYHALRDFPADGAPGDVLAEVRDGVKQYEEIVERMQRVEREIGRLLDKVTDEELKSKLTPPLREIVESRHVENLARLDPFLSTAGKEELPAHDRLALAISGWLVGSAFAEADLDRALRLLEAREKIQQYLVQGNAPQRRQNLIAELRGKELATVDLAARIIEHLPPVLPTPNVQEGKPVHIQVANTAIEYWALLPMEYNPYRSYPVILTLHPSGLSPVEQIEWWSSAPAFQASRQGYIVVAPEYEADPKKGFEHDMAAHDAVLYALIDARKRFAVDSDRVFLSGHLMGGDAAWDIGLAHPDLFAGVIPICGSPKKYCPFYWQNGEHVPLYVVEGEKDGNGPETNRVQLDKMMANGYDAIYVEYRGRGREGFSDEILRLFEWMGRKARQKFPLNFSCRSARPCDNEFYCVSVDDFVPGVLMDPRLFDAEKMKPAVLEGKLTQSANSIQLTLRGPKQAELWLSPGMVDLAQPVVVRVNGDIKNRKAVPLDLETLLEDFRLRGDRQKLFYAKLSFSRL